MKTLVVSALSVMLVASSMSAMAARSFHGGSGFHGGFHGDFRGPMMGGGFRGPGFHGGDFRRFDRDDFRFRRFDHRHFRRFDRDDDVFFGLVAGGLLGYGLGSAYSYPDYTYPQQCYYYPGTYQVYCTYPGYYGYPGYYPYGYGY